MVKEFVFTMEGFGSEDLPLSWPQCCCLVPLTRQFHGHTSRTYRFSYIQDYEMPFVSGLAAQQLLQSLGPRGRARVSGLHNIGTLRKPCRAMKHSRSGSRKPSLSTDCSVSADGAKAEAVELNIAYTEQNFIKTRSAECCNGPAVCHGLSPYPMHVQHGIAGCHRVLSGVKIF